MGLDETSADARSACLQWGAMVVTYRLYICERHRLPIRAWRSKTRAFMAFATVLDLASQVPVIAATTEACGGTVECIDQALVQHAPLCCYLGDERMAEVYAAAEAIPPGRVMTPEEQVACVAQADHAAAEYLLTASPSEPLGLLSAIASNGNHRPLDVYVRDHCPP